MIELLDEIKIEPTSKDIKNDIYHKWDLMDKPQNSLGNIEKMVAKYGSMLGNELPEELKPAMLLMCGDHGIAKYGVSAYPPEVTIQMINGYMRGTAGANVMARHANTDLFVVDVGVNADLTNLKGVRNEKVAWGTEDFTKGPAMTKNQAIKALQVGIKVADECIDKGYNLLVTAEMGIGNTTSTAAIASAMLNLEPELTVGRGTGINDERMQIKRRVVAEGLAVNSPIADDALDVLCKLGGYDHAGLAGMIIGGARRRVPTMIDGVNATAAALIAWKLYPECSEYMLCSHLSEEIAHKKMLSQLNLHPIVDAGMRLGEGTGASLAIVVLQTALGLYKEMNKQ
ncbi:MAG: nicotinate-nucleotide--dimethylbenzimidazole phosphoribosyltransferase [Acidaminococcaceae bacterium]|nr:nicotinate-nucleotide--dimethylbenzimidazole phosphoribosyltransferase [Acidaminococcaceae bacterium]